MSESNPNEDGQVPTGSPTSNETRLDSNNSQIGSASQVVNSPGAAVNNTHLTQVVSRPGLIERMLGPAADELAAMWADQVRTYRLERQTNCVKKAERMLAEAGITPSAVPPKILFPLLEGASFEDDEEMHTMWSALLANATLPRSNVRPSFIATLKQMAPDEAAILVYLEDELDFNLNSRDPIYLKGVAKFHEQRFGRSSENAALISLQNLEALFLIEQREGGDYWLTHRGNWFLMAVRPPKPRP